MLWRCDPSRVMASSFLRFLDHTQRRTTVGRTPLDEWSARRKDLYITTHNTHNRLTSMSPVGFEPTISAGERPQTYALDHATTGTGNNYLLPYKNIIYHTYLFLDYIITDRTKTDSEIYSRFLQSCPEHTILTTPSLISKLYVTCLFILYVNILY